MKLFVIADIHGSLPALTLALQAFHQEQADYIVLLGDILNHGPRNPVPNGYEPAMVAVKLNEYAKRIIAVRGNCDSEVDQGLLDFPIDASYNQLLVGDKRVFISHGHLYHPQKLPPLERGDVFCYGHTHVAEANKQKDIVLFNPGSITLPRGEQNTPSYGLIEPQGVSVKRLSDSKLILFQDLG